MFTFTLVEILVFGGWVVLTPAKGDRGRKSVKLITKLEQFLLNYFVKHLYEVMFSKNGIWRMSLPQKWVWLAQWLMRYEVLMEGVAMLSWCGFED